MRSVANVRCDPTAQSAARGTCPARSDADEEDNRRDPDATHAGTATRRYIDASGCVVRTEQTLGTQTCVSSDVYDIKGQLIEHVDATGAYTRFSHDLLGHVLRLERPEALQLAVFDASGNHVESRTGLAVVLRRYEIANRPIAVHHGSDGTPPVASYVYHDTASTVPADAGQHTAGGRLVRIDDEAGTTLFDYDERGRIARKTMSSGGTAPLTLQLTHRADGLIDSVTYPDATSIRYRYDERGRLRGIDGG
jgi:YD repeat-containing protein